MSFIDENERAHVDAQFQRCSDLVAQASWREAQQVCDGILSYIDAVSGNLDDDDVRRFGYDWPDDRVQVYMNSAALQQALGVSAQQWSVCSPAVADALAADEMMPADHLYPSLWSGSDGIRVLFYNGQFDLNCAAAGTLKYLRALLGDSVYLQAEKRVWRQDGSGNSSSAPRGFVRDFVVEGAAYNVTALVVAGAGHMVPKTQRLHSLELLEHLIRNKPF
jgi:carboxypeptidase C (cathepsin A)